MEMERVELRGFPHETEHMKNIRNKQDWEMWTTLPTEQMMAQKKMRAMQIAEAWRKLEPGEANPQAAALAMMRVAAPSARPAPQDDSRLAPAAHTASPAWAAASPRR